MEDKGLFDRWLTVHGLRYFEKYVDGEITDERMFDYIDSVKSNILQILLKRYTLAYTLSSFREVLEDFQPQRFEIDPYKKVFGIDGVKGTIVTH